MMKTEKQNVDKRILEQILSEQQQELNIRRQDALCPRMEEQLIDLDSTQAQVVIGVRRSGKSTLCYQRLENAGVRYGYADFDDERLAGIGSDQLNDVLETLYKLNGDFKYLFLDEVQNVDGWHLFVNRMLRQKMHVLITGSNANLLSGELATHLSGRSKEIHLYPFSFKEYCVMKGVDAKQRTTKAEAFRRKAFDEYLKIGGFPELLSISDSRTYVRDLVSNVLNRDIEQRYSISYKADFERMAQHLLNVSPAIVTATDLASQFHYGSEHTAKNYLEYLKQAFLLIGIHKFSWKSRVRMTHEKVYAVDVAMMDKRENAFAGENLGWRLENIVFVQLLRECKANGWDIYYLAERSAECDFVVCDGSNVLKAIQVSYDICSGKTFKREVNGLLTAAKVTGCKNLILLTDHDYGNIERDGMNICIRPVYDWACE